jgi:hypothetical protein
LENNPSVHKGVLVTGSTAAISLTLKPAMMKDRLSEMETDSLLDFSVKPKLSITTFTVCA